MGVEMGLRKYKLPSKDWKFYQVMQERGKPKIVSKRSIYTLPSNPRLEAHISHNRIRFTLAVGPQKQVYHHVYYTWTRVICI
jgi:hypothetical protein